jgi:hypothetical protein
VSSLSLFLATPAGWTWCLSGKGDSVSAAHLAPDPPQRSPQNPGCGWPMALKSPTVLNQARWECLVILESTALWAPCSTHEERELPSVTHFIKSLLLRALGVEDSLTWLKWHCMVWAQSASYCYSQLSTVATDASRGATVPLDSCTSAELPLHHVPESCTEPFSRSFIMLCYFSVK